MFAQKVVIVDLKPQSQNSSDFNSGKANSLQLEINKDKVDINYGEFRKDKKEKLKLKEAKLNYSVDPEKGRDDILRAFIDSNIPNWNISFVVQ